MTDVGDFDRELQIVPESVTHYQAAAECFDIINNLVIGVGRSIIGVANIANEAQPPGAFLAQRAVVKRRQTEDLFEGKLVYIVKGADFCGLDRMDWQEEQNYKDRNLK